MTLFQYQYQLQFLLLLLLLPVMVICAHGSWACAGGVDRLGLCSIGPTLRLTDAAGPGGACEVTSALYRSGSS